MNALLIVCGVAAGLFVFVYVWHRLVLNIKDTRRILRYAKEFFSIFRVLQNVGPTVTFFVSARLKEESAAWQLMHRLAHALAVRGVSIKQGQGPGGMEAVSKGGVEGAALFHGEATTNPRRRRLPLSCTPQVIGFPIELPFEQEPNPFCHVEVPCRFFFPRKYALVKDSNAIILGLGGYGSLDEVFEALTLMQCKHSGAVPVYLVDPEFTQPLLRLVAEMRKLNVINDEDVKLITVLGAQETHGLEVRVIATEEDLVDEIVANINAKLEREAAKKRGFLTGLFARQTTCEN